MGSESNRLSLFSMFSTPKNLGVDRSFFEMGRAPAAAAALFLTLGCCLLFASGGVVNDEPSRNSILSHSAPSSFVQPRVANDDDDESGTGGDPIQFIFELSAAPCDSQIRDAPTCLRAATVRHGFDSNGLMSDGLVDSSLIYSRMRARTRSHTSAPLHYPPPPLFRRSPSSSP